MISERRQLTTTFNRIKGNAILKDKAYIAYLKSKLKKSEEDIMNGKTITSQELKNYIDKMEKEYETNNI